MQRQLHQLFLILTALDESHQGVPGMLLMTVVAATTAAGLGYTSPTSPMYPPPEPCLGVRWLTDSARLSFECRVLEGLASEEYVRMSSWGSRQQELDWCLSSLGSIIAAIATGD